MRNKRGTHQAGLAIAALILMPGCADVIESGDVASCRPAGTQPNTAAQCQGLVPTGVAYALPKGQVQLNWSRTKVAATDLQKAQSALQTAQQTLAADQKSLATAQAKTPPDPTVASLASQVQVDTTAVTMAQENVTLTTANQGNYQETATLTVLPPVPDPDPRAHFVANLSHMTSRNDNLNIGVTNGLLNNATATSADQTPNIIMTVANTAITLAALGGGVPIGGAVGAMAAPAHAAPPPSTCYADSWSTIFDPISATEVQAAESAFATRTENFSLQVTGPATSATAPLAIDPPKGPGVPGLIYRTMTTATLTLGPAGNTTAPAPGNPCPLQAPPAAQSVVAVVPETSTAFLVPARAGAFTTSTFNFGFTNGTLTTYGVQLPSEIAAVAGIPLNIAQSLLSIPAQILQLRVNYDTQATALVNARTQLYQAQVNNSAAVVVAQTQLIQAQTALAQARIGEPTAILTAQTALFKAMQALQSAATPPATTTSQ
jgi:hypothetical protein